MVIVWCGAAYLVESASQFQPRKREPTIANGGLPALSGSQAASADVKTSYCMPLADNLFTPEDVV